MKDWKTIDLNIEAEYIEMTFQQRMKKIKRLKREYNEKPTAQTIYENCWHSYQTMIIYASGKEIKRSGDTGFWSSHLERVSERECGSNPPIIILSKYTKA